MAKSNANWQKAKEARDDEFYTDARDIENSLAHYADYFENKTIYCNCDDHSHSKFFRYFHDRFDELKLKRLITTGYNCAKTEFNGRVMTTSELKGNGDFRSKECVNMAREADLVVTNPPYSLFTDYFKMIEKLKTRNNTDFIAVGPITPCGWGNAFFALSSGIVMVRGEIKYPFKRPDGSEKKVHSLWYTTIPIKPKPLKLEKQDISKFEKYLDANAIEIPSLKSIPADYEGVMGVPITYAKHHNPDVFEIIGLGEYQLVDKATYARFLIRRKREEAEAEIF